MLVRGLWATELRSNVITGAASTLHQVQRGAGAYCSWVCGLCRSHIYWVKQRHVPTFKQLSHLLTHRWESPIHKKRIPMLACPLVSQIESCKYSTWVGINDLNLTLTLSETDISKMSQKTWWTQSWTTLSQVDKQIHYIS